LGANVMTTLLLTAVACLENYSGQRCSLQVPAHSDACRPIEISSSHCRLFKRERRVPSLREYPQQTRNKLLPLIAGSGLVLVKPAHILTGLPTTSAAVTGNGFGRHVRQEAGRKRGVEAPLSMKHVVSPTDQVRAYKRKRVRMWPWPLNLAF